MPARSESSSPDGAIRGASPLLYRAAVNPIDQKYSALPKFGNGVCFAHPGLVLRGDRTSSRVASRACGGRGSVARGIWAGRVVPVSPKSRADERRCSVRRANMSMATCTMPLTPAALADARTAKPCGPGRRRYGQAFAEVWSVQPDQPHRQFAGRGRPEGIRLPGERGISRQPIAQGRPCVGLHLYAAVRFSLRYISRSGPRVPLAPGLPCALLIERVERSGKARADCVARARRCVCIYALAVIARLDRAIQYSETAVTESMAAAY